MKIYIVIEEYIDQSRIVGVYRHEQEAEDVARSDSDWVVEEYEVIE